MSSANTGGNANEEGDETNPYLAMREAKIARNNKRLRDLGLLKQPQPPAAAILATTVRKNTKSRSPQKPTVAIIGPVRRSSRLSSQEKPDYKDASLPNEKQSAGGSGRKRPRSPIMALDNDDATFTYYELPVTMPAAPCRSRKSTAIAKAPAANSVRSIDLDVTKLILGSNNNINTDNKNTTGLLGKMMDHTGKEFVINESFANAASPQDQERLENTNKLSFNKYCGVQEWKNAIFLWVNLDTEDSPNDFLDGARQVTWFGGSRMHDDSPVIHKLIQYGNEVLSSGATKIGSSNATITNNEEGGDATTTTTTTSDNNKATTDSDSSNIILWCRRYRPEVKKFSPYVCFGRLGYKSHVPGSRPLSFVWELLDYEGLKHHDDEVVRETFEQFTVR